MAMDYSTYQQEVRADIEGVLHDYSCQPIVFVGSGLSRRYANAPNWEELLRLLADQCPAIEMDFAYYKQTYGSNFIKIGSVFADFYHQWAWGRVEINFQTNITRKISSRDIYKAFCK